MKVAGGGSAAGGDELFERMRQAHRGDASTVDASEASEVSDAGGPVDSARAGGLEAEAADPAQAALQQSLLETAQRVLDGDFDSSREVREAVVEIIVEQRYAGRLPAAEAEQVVRTMKVTLAQDPTFRQRVDRMLVLAAGQLGSDGP